MRIFPITSHGTSGAKNGFMMTFMLILIAMVAAVLFVELVSATRAPVGYQDEEYFPFGSDHIADSSDLENPS